MHGCSSGSRCSLIFLARGLAILQVQLSSTSALFYTGARDATRENPPHARILDPRNLQETA